MIIILSRKWACRRRRRFMVHKEPVYFFCTRRKYSLATPWLTIPRCQRHRGTIVIGIQA